MPLRLVVGLLALSGVVVGLAVTLGSSGTKSAQDKGTRFLANSTGGGEIGTQAALPASISGAGVGLLYPDGPAVSVDLTIDNPNPSPITIVSVTMSVKGSSTSACTASIRISQQLQAKLKVAGGTTASLSELGIPKSAWPQLRMADNGANQDGCEGATIALAFSGTATG